MTPNYVRTIAELIDALDEAASLRRDSANEYSEGVRDAHAWTVAQLRRLHEAHSRIDQDAVEGWFSNVDLSDLFESKGWDVK